MVHARKNVRLGRLRSAIAAGLATTVMLAFAGVAHAENYSAVSLDGQNGWNGGSSGTFTNNSPGNESVTSDTAHSLSQSWRFSAGYGSPGGGTPYSPQLAASAGLAGTGASGDTMAINFWFKPVGALGDGSQQSLNEGTTARDDRTGSNIYLTNKPGGVVLQTYDGIANNYITLATIADTNWHEVTMITTSSGTNSASETTTFRIDSGSPVTTTPWADLSRDPGPYPTASSVKFTSYNDGPSSTLGYYYDDLSYSVYNNSDPANVLASFSTSFETPEPGSLALLGLSAMFALRRPRRT